MSMYEGTEGGMVEMAQLWLFTFACSLCASWVKWQSKRQSQINHSVFTYKECYCFCHHDVSYALSLHSEGILRACNCEQSQLCLSSMRRVTAFIILATVVPTIMKSVTAILAMLTVVPSFVRRVKCHNIPVIGKSCPCSQSLSVCYTDHSNTVTQEQPCQHLNHAPLCPFIHGHDDQAKLSAKKLWNTVMCEKIKSLAAVLTGKEWDD